MAIKVGGGAGGLDPQQLAEIERLKEKMAMDAAAATGTSSEVPAPTSTGPKPVDRAGARGVLSSQGMQRVEMPPPPSPEEQALTQQMTEKLQKLGYLPSDGKISKPQFDAAAKKFIQDHKDDLSGVNDIDDLFALLDRLIAEDNARNNRAPAWSGQSPARRPGMLPSSGSYAAQGPSKNSGALQQQAAQAIATADPPPPAGSINARIADAAKNYMGTSTAAGPDGGNLACAWSVNNILSNAGLAKVGSNPNYVPSVEAALQNGRGVAVAQKDLKPGDVVIFPNGHHIGIYMGNGKVANNSSSHAAFVNLSNIQSGMHFYRVTS